MQKNIEETEINEVEKDVDDVQIYELGYHILPTVVEESVPAEVSKIHEIINKSGGTIISHGAPSLRNLAYDLEKRIETKKLHFGKAYFGWVKFELNRSEIGNIKNKVENLPNTLRTLIIKTVKENTMFVPKASVFKKEENTNDANEVVTNPAEPKEEVSEAEIDKSIDELVDKTL